MAEIRTADVYVKRIVHQTTKIRVNYLANQDPHKAALEGIEELPDDEWRGREIDRYYVATMEAMETRPGVLAANEFIEGPFANMGEPAEASVLVHEWLQDERHQLAALAMVARLYRDDPEIGGIFTALKEALLGNS